MGRQVAFENDLRILINTYSRENTSNTPDFVLAQYLEGCLTAFDTAMQQRDKWHGLNTILQGNGYVADGVLPVETPREDHKTIDKVPLDVEGEDCSREKAVAMGIAAQAWCTPATEQTIMDPILAEAFADILVARSLTNSIGDALRRIQAAFDAEHGFRETYVANVAMRMYDTFANHPEVYGRHNPFADYAARNDLASSIVDLVFKG